MAIRRKPSTSFDATKCPPITVHAAQLTEPHGPTISFGTDATFMGNAYFIHRLRQVERYLPKTVHIIREPDRDGSAYRLLPHEEHKSMSLQELEIIFNQFMQDYFPGVTVATTSD